MLFVNFLKKNAEAGQAFFKKLLLVSIYICKSTVNVSTFERTCRSSNASSPIFFFFLIFKVKSSYLNFF